MEVVLGQCLYCLRYSIGLWRMIGITLVEVKQLYSVLLIDNPLLAEYNTDCEHYNPIKQESNSHTQRRKDKDGNWQR